MNWIKEKAKIRENPKNIWNEAKKPVFGLNYGPSRCPLIEIKNKRQATYLYMPEGKIIIK